jgi:integrase
VAYLIKSIKIHDHKNHNTYQAFIFGEAKELLQETMQNLDSSDYVISYDRGKITDDKRIQRRLKPLFDSLFNKSLTIDDRENRVVQHTLRHRFASLLAIKGESIFLIMKLMNHKDINMTMRYAKLAPENGCEAVKGLF